MTVAIKSAYQLRKSDVIAVGPQSAATVAYTVHALDGSIVVALVDGGQIKARPADSFAVVA